MHPLLQEMVARAQHEDIERYLVQQERLSQLPAGPTLRARIHDGSAHWLALLPRRVRLLLHAKTTN